MCDVIALPIADVLRRFFKKQIKAVCSHSWNDKQDSGRWIITKCKWTKEEDFKKEQQWMWDLIEEGDTSKWDITLLCRALLHPRLGLCQWPQKRAIKRLKDLRNKNFHLSTNEIPDKEFTDSIVKVILSYQAIDATPNDYASLVKAIRESGTLNIILSLKIMSLWYMH